jgi:hypothetical protein
MASKEDMIRAVDLAIAGKWDEAHTLAQRSEGDATADWLHAVLHKIEGDEENSRYWYRRTTHEYEDHVDPHVELATIRDSLSR